MPSERRLGHATIERDMSRLASYTGIINFQPLRSPLTHTSFDGDSFSDVGTSTKIENSSWSDTIPTGAVALLMEHVVLDGFHFMDDDTWKIISQVIPCTNGDVYYQCESTGAATLDVILKVWGWWA